MRQNYFTIFSIVLLFTLPQSILAGNFKLNSPDKKISVNIGVGNTLEYSVAMDNNIIVKPSTISMTISNGVTFGENNKVVKVSRSSANQKLRPTVYKKNIISDIYNEINIELQNYSIIFRAYNDGVAYRFVSKLENSYQVMSEKAEFNFSKDFRTFVPYVRDNAGNIEKQFYNSFENTYSVHKVSEWDKSRLAFLPVLFDDDSVKICITEADLLNYPGMYLHNADSSTSVKARFAPYPKEIKQGGHNMLQGEVQSRYDYIARAVGHEKFPWRVIILAREDKELLNSDMVWKLASPADKNMDFSWVKPGKVAWDWWNDWNLYGVDFKAGINNDTYKYYIDFASKNNIEYVILDEGWAVNKKADLFNVVKDINLKELTKYAEAKGVGLILWAGYWAFNSDMEKVCRHYSEMGIKGFKVDFMDRDDQDMVNFYKRAAYTAAKYHLMIDFHGAYKPTGLQRTYPNVINFEGVHGLEQMKWSNADQVTYDVMIPFIRMVAGPMDYTQGAMRNANRKNFRPVNSEPMSQGTRCHQLAEYIIFESPLNMLCDSPSNYISEPECTQFIAECPETWDETVALQGKGNSRKSMCLSIDLCKSEQKVFNI